MEVSVAHEVPLILKFVWTPNLCWEEKIIEKSKNHNSYEVDGYSASPERSARGKGYVVHGMDFNIWEEQ